MNHQFNSDKDAKGPKDFIVFGPFCFSGLHRPPYAQPRFVVFFYVKNQGDKMYLHDEILPLFKKWIDSMSKVVPMEDVKDYGRFFISNKIDPEKAKTRGAVYDLFEDVSEYAKMRKIMMAGDLDSSEKARCENMKNIANGIVWAVEHDGFDTVKYDPISMWGKDIKMSHDYM